MLSDQCARLWDIVKRRITPLGEPRGPGEPRLVLVEEPGSLDLHNLTLQEAHASTRSYLGRCAKAGKRDVEVITGKSGKIRSEFVAWAMLDPNVRAIEELNGGGAFKVILRR